MIRMFARHPVKDYTAWKKVYDSFDRRGRGVRDDAVFQSAEDPNDVTVWHDFDDLGSARSFAESEDLRKTMKEAGVVGDPTIWFTRPV